MRSLGKTLLTFALLRSVLQVQICLLLQVFLDFLHISFQIIAFVFFGKSPEVDWMGHMVVLVLIIRRLYLFIPLVCVYVCVAFRGLCVVDVLFYIASFISSFAFLISFLLLIVMAWT